MAPTARGTGLLVAAVALLAAGFGYGYPELAVLGASAVLAAGTALAHLAWQPRLGVSRRAEPDRVPRGGTSVLTLTVTNTSRLRPATLVAHDRCGATAASAAAGGRPGIRTVPVPVSRLRPSRDTTVRYPVPTDRRGVVPIGPLQVTRRDPFGLVGLVRSQGGTTQVWVYPRIHPLIAVPAGVARSLDGQVDRVPHGSITFDTLREYVVGDELRHVHWRTTARVGELMVREHLDTSLPRIVVLLDDRAASYPSTVDGVVETFESACEAAASVVAAAVREDLAITLHLAGGRTAGSGRRAAAAGPARPTGGTPTGGTPTGDAPTGDTPAGGVTGITAGTRDFLDLLAEATLQPGTGSQPLQTATRRLRQQRLGDTLVYLTGPGGRADLGLVGALRGGYPSIVVGVFSDSAEPTPADAGLVVLDARDGADFAAKWDSVTAW